METRKHVHDIKQNRKGMTKLLVAIPMSQRIGLGSSPPRPASPSRN